MRNESRGRAAWMLAIVALTIAGAQRAAAQGLEPIAYGGLTGRRRAQLGGGAEEKLGRLSPDARRSHRAALELE